MPKLSNLVRFTKDRQYRLTTSARLAMRCFAKVCKNVDFVGIKQNGQTLMLPIDCGVISPTTVAHGLTDAADFSHVLQLAAEYDHPISGVMLEIGGNIGTTTVAAAMHPDIRRLLSFEPDPSNYEFLVGNVALNKHSDKVQTFQAAVGAEVGSVTLQLSEKHRGAHRVVVGDVGAADKPSRNVEVSCTTIDEIVATHHPADEIGLVWIDVEGYEGYVLEGAKELIKRRQACFVTEFWPHGMTESGSIKPYVAIAKESFDRIVDIDANQAYTTDAIDELIAKYSGRKEYTNVLLLQNR